MKGRKRITVKLGDVFEIKLPDGRYAYGRVYRENVVGIYRLTSDLPNNPPIGSREFLFHVGMYKDVFRTRVVTIVGQDPFKNGEDAYAPPMCIKDPLSGRFELYHRGKTRPATANECRGLERVAGWDITHIIDRILHGKKSKFLRAVNED
jgi:hypothetical protein